MNGGYGLEYFEFAGEKFVEIRCNGKKETIHFEDFLRYSEIRDELKRIVKKHCGCCKKVDNEYERMVCFLKENFSIYDTMDDIEVKDETIILNQELECGYGVSY